MNFLISSIGNPEETSESGPGDRYPIACLVDESVLVIIARSTFNYYSLRRLGPLFNRGRKVHI